MNARIPCAYDGSADAEKAFDFALTVASAFSRWLMGSVSHRVISCATCTVTVVR